MDRHALDVLELPAIRERLADETSFAGGRALVAALEPSSDPAEVADRQARTAEAIRLHDAGPPRLGGADDVRSAAAHAARGGVLTPATLAAVAATVRVALDTRGVLAQRTVEAPLLAETAAVIEPGLGALADRVERAIEADGSGVRDGASPALRGLRRAIADARRRATERLRALAASPGLRTHLQEDFITERNGRPVLAVKASSRSAVPGIVHDSSGSGQTLFVEPFSVVELINEASEAVAAERDEVERILAELSAGVGTWAAALETAVGALAELDLALARGLLSRRWGGCPVEATDGSVELLGARHPLLDAATAVPVDLPLAGLRAVVVSGPNTGGKTVALKTLGLAALLHQCGLRPPARTARLPVFDAVLADIGDEQSIAASLSTFSGHVRNLVAILAQATDRSLVLVDEIAAGTDPVEGAALARALLADLVERGALVLVTTHYAELKEWASAHPQAENAAVGFDPDALAPTYLLAIGRPGASHALQIAERLGLDPGVVRAARGTIAPERRAAERLLADAAGAERDAARARAEAERDRDLAEDARAAAERRVTELEAALEAVRAGQSAAREQARREAETRARRRGTRARRAAGRDPRGPARGGAPPPGRAGTVAGRRPRRSRARPQAGRGRPPGAGGGARGGERAGAPGAAARAARRRRSGRRAGARACAARSRSCPARRPRCTAPAASACASPSPSCSPTRAAAAATGRPSARCRCGPRPRRTSRASSTCAACEPTRRARPCDASSTRRTSPGARRCGSSTAAARGRCARRCATSSRPTRWSRPPRRRAWTALHWCAWR